VAKALIIVAAVYIDIRTRRSRVKRAGVRAALGEQKILLIILGIVAVLAFVRPMFVSSENLFNILFQVSITSIIGIGMTFLMIGADFDLSVGSNMVFATTVAILLEGLGGGLNLAAAVLAATLAGFVNGVLVAKLKINSFITTLSMMFFLRGLVLIFTNKKTISGSEHALFDFGYGSLFGVVPYPVVAAAVLLVVFRPGAARTVLGATCTPWAATRRPPGCSARRGRPEDLLLLADRLPVRPLRHRAAVPPELRLRHLRDGHRPGRHLRGPAGRGEPVGREGSVFKAFLGILLLGVLSNAMIALHVTPICSRSSRGCC